MPVAPDARSSLFLPNKNPDPGGNLRKIERWSRPIWQALTLAAGWTPFADAHFSPLGFPQWCVDGFGFVHMRGLITSPVQIITTNTNMASVPISAAPVAYTLFQPRASWNTAESPTRVDVYTDGTINWAGPATNANGVAWVDLTAIMYSILT